MRRLVGRGFLGAYRLGSRVWAKAFSLAAAGAYASFGARSVVQPPVRLVGERRIAVGDDVYVGAGSWLQTLDGYGSGVALELGDGTNISGGCVLSAAVSADHGHAFEDTALPVLAQGFREARPVEIGDGAWLGENVVVCPGVRIGRGAVVGANAVVLDDVPDHAVAVGAPARVVRRFAVAVEAV
jgi:acetyltransferase-like isoleucine patch superfamily enzyme